MQKNPDSPRPSWLEGTTSLRSQMIRRLAEQGVSRVALRTAMGYDNIKMGSVCNQAGVTFKGRAKSSPDAMRKALHDAGFSEAHIDAAIAGEREEQVAIRPIDKRASSTNGLAMRRERFIFPREPEHVVSAPTPEEVEREAIRAICAAADGKMR